MDQAGRVTALDGDLDLLDAPAELGPAGLLWPEEEPREQGHECGGPGGYEDLVDAHRLCLLTL